MAVPPGFILKPTPPRRFYYTDTDIRGRIRSAKDIDYALHAEDSCTSENRFDVIVLRNVNSTKSKADLFTLPATVSQTIEERLRESKDGDRYMDLLIHMYSVAGQQITSNSLWVHSQLVKGALHSFGPASTISPRTMIGYLILSSPPGGVQLKRRKHPDPTHALQVGDVILCGARDDLEILEGEEEVAVLRMMTIKDETTPLPPPPPLTTLATYISRLAIGRTVCPTPNFQPRAGPVAFPSPAKTSPLRPDVRAPVSGTPYYRYSNEQLILHNAEGSSTPIPSPRKPTRTISAFKTSRRMFSTSHSKRPHPANNFPLLDAPIRAFDYSEDRQRSEIRLRSDVQGSKAAPSYSPRKRIKLETPDVVAAIPSAQLLEMGIVGASIRWEAARAGRSRKGTVKKETVGPLSEVNVEITKEPLFLEYDSTDSM